MYEKLDMPIPVIVKWALSITPPLTLLKQYELFGSISRLNYFQWLVYAELLELSYLKLFESSWLY